MRSKFYKFVKMHVALSVHIKYQYHSDTKNYAKQTQTTNPTYKETNQYKAHEVCAVFSLLRQYATVQQPKYFKAIIFIL